MHAIGICTQGDQNLANLGLPSWSLSKSSGFPDYDDENATGGLDDPSDEDYHLEPQATVEEINHEVLNDDL